VWIRLADLQPRNVLRIRSLTKNWLPERQAERGAWRFD
jgi:hypothetical protein